MPVGMHRVLLQQLPVVLCVALRCEEPDLQLDGVGPAVLQLSCCSSPAYSWARSRRDCNRANKAMHGNGPAKVLVANCTSLKGHGRRCALAVELAALLHLG